MKLGELYGVMAVIFATNFKGVIAEENLRKMSKNWIIKNETDNNRLGHEHWEKALGENIEAIKADFEALSPAFDFAFFKLVSETDATLFFERLRYKKPFSDLPAAHSANMLACLNAILKVDKDEKAHFVLGDFLTNYFIFSARALGEYLQINAKTDYYKAMGYFFSDFCNMIKISLGLKA